MGLPKQHSISYPKIIDYRLLPSANSLDSAWVDENGIKTGEVKINEEIRQAVGYKNPNDKTLVDIGEPERYCVTEVNNNKCVDGHFETKMKKTFEYPNGDKYSIFINNKEGIVRIRKFSEGKWQLIAYKTPAFSFANAYSYGTLEKSSGFFRPISQSITSNLGIQQGFWINDVVDAQSREIIIENIDRKGVGNFFNLRYLSNGEKKLIKSSALSYVEQISKLAKNILKFAKL